ncbi:MAG: hypothetical protein K9K81_09975 [Desulfobacteraceae bacterium]|nr:hypothetical protein [Desulfobacteraceae bacterium]
MALDNQGHVYGGTRDGKIMGIFPDGQMEVFVDTKGRPFDLYFDTVRNQFLDAIHPHPFLKAQMAKFPKAVWPVACGGDFSQGDDRSRGETFKAKPGHIPGGLLAGFASKTGIMNAIHSEDAFDAAVSALVMGTHFPDFDSLSRPDDISQFPVYP